MRSRLPSKSNNNLAIIIKKFIKLALIVVWLINLISNVFYEDKIPLRVESVQFSLAFFSALAD